MFDDVYGLINGFVSFDKSDGLIHGSKRWQLQKLDMIIFNQQNSLVRRECIAITKGQRGELLIEKMIS